MKALVSLKPGFSGDDTPIELERSPSPYEVVHVDAHAISSFCGPRLGGRALQKQGLACIKVRSPAPAGESARQGGARGPGAVVARPSWKTTFSRP